MVVFLLLLIVAILLFGSSAVIGFIGQILGLIAALVAITFGIMLFQDNPVTVSLVLAGFFSAIAILGYIVFRADRNRRRQIREKIEAEYFRD